jgi:hypothetical protein
MSIGSFSPASSFSSAARRSLSGLDASIVLPVTRQSNAMNIAGVSAASLRTRLSAGCSRSWSASNAITPPVAISNSPSMTKRLAFNRANIAAISGK